MILEDFVMLGTTVPEPSKSDDRIFVCSAGVSREYGRLVRIYPLARRGIPKRWNVYRVPLERNSKDNRDESFKVRGNRSEEAHEGINSSFELVGKVSRGERAALLEPHVVGSIKEANERSRCAETARERFSLAIIHPKEVEIGFQNNPDSPDSPQQGLFDLEAVGKRLPQGAKRFAYTPRIRFQDERGENNLMLRCWGAFEFQRKQGEEYFRKNLEQALHLSSRSSLLVGNFNQHRNSWLVISVLNGIREEPALFSLGGAA